jgi:hypothetical protein
LRRVGQPTEESILTDFIGSLGPAKILELNFALLDAVGLTIEELA